MNDSHQIAARVPEDENCPEGAYFYERSSSGGSWERIPFLELLKWDNKPSGTKDDFDKYEKQLSEITPKLMTNADPTTAGIVIGGYSFPNGVPSQIYFTAYSATDYYGYLDWGYGAEAYFLDLDKGVAGTPSSQWHYVLKKMQVPTGWTAGLTALSNSGCAAGLGYSPTNEYIKETLI